MYWWCQEKIDVGHSWDLKGYRLQNSRFFFSKSVKKSVKRGVSVLRARRAILKSVSFQTFCLTARTYLNKQKYGLFCSLKGLRPWPNLELFIRQTKLSELISWKFRLLAQLSSSEWVWIVWCRITFFITSILKSLAIRAIWLSRSSVIYS